MDGKSRASKQLGDFGEGLATYTLIRKGFEVACVDHVGADLIAQKTSIRIAVSVKTRRFRAGSKETRGLDIEYAHIERLEHFANRFGLEAAFAHVACDEDARIIHLFLLRVADIKEHLDKGPDGFRFRFDARRLVHTISLPYVDYSSWASEQIDCKLWPNDSDPDKTLPLPPIL